MKLRELFVEAMGLLDKLELPLDSIKAPDEAVRDYEQVVGKITDQELKKLYFLCVQERDRLYNLGKTPRVAHARLEGLWALFTTAVSFELYGRNNEIPIAIRMEWQVVVKKPRPIWPRK